MESLGLGLCNRVSHDGENYVLVVVLYLLSRTHRKMYTARKVLVKREKGQRVGLWTVRVWTQRGLGALHLAFAH
jgi:hypothetical protein